MFYLNYIFFQEIAVLSQCRSPYITEYYGSYLHQTKLWIIMEYMAGGSVADLVGNLIFWESNCLGFVMKCFLQIRSKLSCSMMEQDWNLVVGDCSALMPFVTLCYCRIYSIGLEKARLTKSWCGILRSILSRCPGQVI